MPRSTPLSGPRPGSAGNAGSLDGSSDQHATADYIHDLSGQLSELAQEVGLDLLAYLLNMVQIEAESVRNRTGLLARSGASPPSPGPMPADVLRPADEPQG